MTYKQGLIRRHSNELGIIHRLLDALCIVIALWLCAWGYGVTIDLHYEIAVLIAVVNFMLLAEWFGLYSSWRSESLRHETGMILQIWVLAFCIMLALGFLSKTSFHYSRVAIVAWTVAAPILLVLERLALRQLLRRFRQLGLNSRAVAIVGSGESAAQLLDTIANSPWMGLRIEGIYDEANNTPLMQRYPELERSVDMLLQQVQEKNIDRVYITYPIQQEEKIRLLVEQLADSPVAVHIVPDLFISKLLNARWTSLGGIPLVSVFESPIYGASMFLKRLEDIILGSMILLLITPVLLTIAVAIKSSSAGPVLFKQRRYGLDGQLIEVWKFRSMSVMEDGAQITQAQKNDPRVTPLGAFLRRTSLDELPQFINVLQGQMSIVGPRPHAVAHNEQYRKLIPGYMLRHKVKPGITGWAQVNGWRGETDTIEKMEMRVKYDLEYINNWSLWFDLKIIWMTIMGGMRHENAY